MIRKFVLVLVLLCIGTVALTPAGDFRSAASFLLLWILPGLAWGLVFDGRWLIGCGLGLSINVLLTLILTYLVGFAPPSLGIPSYLISALLPLGLALKNRDTVRSKVRVRISLLAVVLVASFFRLVNLGYSEFQGDEGVIMVRAATVIEGDDQELFLHQKGPVEILVPLAQWLVGESINEFWARLPFAWFSLLGVIATYRLGERWFGQPAGIFSSSLLAINGFHVAFARIVQYQSWVVLMALLALLALDCYRRSPGLQPMLLGSVFMSSGLLGHYDAVLFAPAAAVLVFMAQRWKWKWVLMAAMLGVIILALFYVPYTLSPNFIKTASYVAGDRVGGQLNFNGDKAWTMSTVYNSSYYVVALGVLLIVGWRFRPFRVAYGALLTFLVPFLFYLIVVFDPRTHLYTFYPGASLLAGVTLAGFWQALARRRWSFWIAASGVGYYVLCAAYIWFMFVNHRPEYQREFPNSQFPIYLTTYDEIPLYGRFGFPHQAGWRAFGDYIETSGFAGWYASNEEQEITDWYTRQAPRTHCPDPDLYVIAENVQDEIAIDWKEVDAAYHLAGTVEVNGQETLRWYSKQRVEPVVELIADEHRLWWRPEQVTPKVAGVDYPVDVTLGEKIRLLGYDLDASEAYPGGRLNVTLYWQALEPLDRNYQVFVHLYDGQMRGQDDGAPECAINPTSRWEPGQIVPDQHQLSIDVSTPVGSVPLLVGMYDLITRDRLDVPGTDGAVFLLNVKIDEEQNP